MKNKTYYAHPTSDVEKGARIGRDTKIWHFCHIMKGAKIGRECKIGQNVAVHPLAVIGNNVKIQNNVSIYNGVTLEDDVFCGPSCVFTNIINPRSAFPRHTAKDYKKILVKKGSSIGANATIVCGVTLGRHCFIGAGAVVTQNVKDYELVYGTPARPRGWMCECGEKLTLKNNKATCKACRRKYQKTNTKVRRSK